MSNIYNDRMTAEKRLSNAQGYDNFSLLQWIGIVIGAGASVGLLLNIDIILKVILGA